MDTIDETAVLAQAKQDGITHLATGVAIVRDGKLLLVRRAGGDYLGGVYELPGGGVDAGETITEGAVREVKEETGLTVTAVLGTFPGFDYATDRKPRARQINFMVTVGPGDVVLDPHEHSGFAWVDSSTVADLPMSPEMRRCVAEALANIAAAGKP